MNIYITRKLPVEAIEFLKDKNFKVTIHNMDAPVTRQELIKNIKKVDGLISLLTDKIDAAIIDEMQSCRIIANYAVGYNNIDIEHAKRKNIVITNTPDVLTNSTADLAMALTLGCARKFYEGEKLVRSKKFSGWSPNLLLGIELRNKTYGIIGAGRIGTAVALRAKAFGCNIVYYSRSKNKIIENKTNAKKVGLNTLLEKSDFISLHIPLTPETFRMIDKKKLSLLKETAILINTARGEVWDEKEVIRLLKNKKIFAAGFDVYENEPDINPELLNLENVILLPHLGSATFDTRREMALLAAKNVAAVLSGKPPLTPV